MSKTYNNIEDAYKDLVGPMTFTARRHIFNTDYAIDAVNDAFTKTLEYLQTKPESKISPFILNRELVRACRRLNKRFSREVPCGSFANFQEALDKDTDDVL